MDLLNVRDVGYGEGSQIPNAPVMIIYPEGTESTPQTDPQKQIERFPNLRSPASEIALKLESYRHQKDLIVLGIALGGVPLTHEVAKHLAAPLDLIIIRRLLTPEGPGSQVCAANVAGQMVLPDEILPLPESPATPLEYFVADALAQLQQRAELCRPGRQPVEIADKTVVLVDCGAKTGLTMQASIEAVRARKPARIIVAVPVASLGACEAIVGLADDFICLATPQPFGHVGLWYKDFTRPDDEHVGELLD